MDRRAVFTLGVAVAAALPAGAWPVEAQPASGAPSTAVKLIAIYDRPDDPVSFFKHYETVHAPLVKRTPGLQTFVLNRITANALGGEAPFVLIAEMTYPDRAAFEAAMKSPENQAVGNDLMGFAKGKVTVVVAEVAEA